MGLFDAITGKKEEKEKETESESPAGKFDEECAACGGQPSDKKWMGQYWHKKCPRKIRKSTKGII